MSYVVHKRDGMSDDDAEKIIREMYGSEVELTRKYYPNLTLWFIGEPDKNFQNYIAEMGKAALVIEEGATK